MGARTTSGRSHERGGGRTSTEHHAAQRIDKPPFMMLKRVTMAAVTAFVTVNIWTGAPLVALWAGSEVVAERTLSMAAVGVVVFVLAVLEFGLALALTWLNNVYDELIGRPSTERRATWLRSMRAEAEGHVSQRVGITLLERIVMINVYIGVVALLIWFILFAGSPLPR
jgi:hypothetical protein